MAAVPARADGNTVRDGLDYLWARVAHARHFGAVRTFCLFVGYPRSGHSVVGALLNAHRNAVISHQLPAVDRILSGCTRNELFARILARAAWFHRRGDRGHFPFAVPNQWQGRFDSLQVIGDKRGGAVGRAIEAHSDFLDRTRALVGVPLKLVHVVRNPFDNIAAIARWHDLSLARAVDYYFRHARVVATLDRTLGTSEIVTVRHEDLIESPRPVLARLCAFLGLACYPGYLDDCASVVFRTPTYSRRRASWDVATIRDVERRMKPFPFLDGYVFELADPTAVTPVPERERSPVVAPPSSLSPS